MHSMPWDCGPACTACPTTREGSYEVNVAAKADGRQLDKRRRADPEVSPSRTSSNYGLLFDFHFRDGDLVAVLRVGHRNVGARRRVLQQCAAVLAWNFLVALVNLGVLADLVLDVL